MDPEDKANIFFKDVLEDWTEAVIESPRLNFPTCNPLDELRNAAICSIAISLRRIAGHLEDGLGDVAAHIETATDELDLIEHNTRSRKQKTQDLNAGE